MTGDKVTDELRRRLEEHQEERRKIDSGELRPFDAAKHEEHVGPTPRALTLLEGDTPSE